MNCIKHNEYTELPYCPKCNAELSAALHKLNPIKPDPIELIKGRMEELKSERDRHVPYSKLWLECDLRLAECNIILIMLGAR